jgi:tRNA modification GTPase
VTTPQIATWIACLTPPGQAALATLGVVGPRAWDAVRAVFRPRSGELPEQPSGGRFWLGRMGGDVADEVVVAIKRVTPNCWIEIHGHGGREVVRFLKQLLLSQGLQDCSWQDFVRLTTDDPLAALAAICLADAPTVRTAAILLDQQAGALGRALESCLVSIDKGDLDTSKQLLENLCQHSALGRHLTQPWRVVIAGAPNVGKSSLVNALAGYQRSIVSATPGTTRDVVSVQLAIDGWPVEIVDTAGLRESGQALEEEGMHRARATAVAADLCLWVLDATATPAWPDVPGATTRWVVNKIDQPAAWDLATAAGAVHVSARTGEGIPELCTAISGWLVPQPPLSGSAVPFTAGLSEGAEQALKLVVAGSSSNARRLIAQSRAGGTPTDS